MDCSELAAEAEVAVLRGLGNYKHREQTVGDH